MKRGEVGRHVGWAADLARGRRSDARGPRDSEAPGWLGGRGFDGTAAFMSTLRYRNEKAAALLAGLAENLRRVVSRHRTSHTSRGSRDHRGGFNAAVRVHFKNGIWNSNGGIELPFIYAAAAHAPAFYGSGAHSLDALFEWHLSGSRGLS
jgi:putative oxidoreductase